MSDDYKRKLWEEIARNDPLSAKFIRDMHTNFNSHMHTFRWCKAPAHVFCVFGKPVRLRERA